MDVQVAAEPRRRGVQRRPRGAQAGLDELQRPRRQRRKQPEGDRQGVRPRHGLKRLRGHHDADPDEDAQRGLDRHDA